MSDIIIYLHCDTEGFQHVYVFGPATLEIRGIHYVCCDKPQHYGGNRRHLRNISDS